MTKLIIAIDGPVGSGKSTVARRVAELLGYLHLDSGAMYRAVALGALRAGVSLDDAAGLERVARAARIELEMDGAARRVLLDGEDVTERLRGPEMSQQASRVALVPGVRRVLVANQQRMGAAGGIVVEGRDIGTVVFPHAELKVFLDADIEVRARRRWLEYEQKGRPTDLLRMIQEVEERDHRDRDRAASPLRRAADAVYVDCSAMEAEEVARLVALVAREREVASGVAQGE
ncbi:MAG TPA: (d)CMP kinase [Candidatus Acidoferrales bacterium]|nr:(d)CMP kinase [Candidatus Acidoferrales bacterium]